MYIDIINLIIDNSKSKTDKGEYHMHSASKMKPDVRGPQKPRPYLFH